MGKGGSRYGAGRPAQYRKTYNMNCIDVRRLQRDGCLKDGMAYDWAWKDDQGNVTSSISMRIHGGGVQFDYRMGEHRVSQHVSTTATACNYGGNRVWFICPHCNRRCAHVYISRKLACRNCQRLKYPSQSDDETDASWRRQCKLAAKIGAKHNEWAWKQKPKGMHQSTFQRIRGEIIEEETQREALLVARWRSMFGKEHF